MNNKFYLSVLAATVVAFLGGWLVFGVIFADYYMSHTNEAAKILMKDPPEMWAIAIANLAWSVLITYVLEKTGGNTFLKGFMTGAWVSFLTMVVFDISMYAFWNMYDLGFIFVDILIGTIFWGIVGGVAGAVLGSKHRTVAA